MDTIQNRISAFVELGKFLSQFTQEETIQKNDDFCYGYVYDRRITSYNIIKNVNF